jgi:predicted RNA-binding protein YlxR (DUF448 family)
MKNTFNTSSAALKHTPQRTCVTCRQVKAKRELLRLVRTSDGNIELDETGKKDGRGAYVCPSSDCWEKALAGKQLERTLRLTLSTANRENLKKRGGTLF